MTTFYMEGKILGMENKLIWLEIKVDELIERNKVLENELKKERKLILLLLDHKTKQDSFNDGCYNDLQETKRKLRKLSLINNQSSDQTSFSNNNVLEFEQKNSTEYSCIDSSK